VDAEGLGKSAGHVVDQGQSLLALRGVLVLVVGFVIGSGLVIIADSISVKPSRWFSDPAERAGFPEVVMWASKYSTLERSASAKP
jgi:hypothetical protein